MVGADDGELLDRMRRGDADALVALYDRHGRAAFSLAYRILGNASDAEEVVQDAFLRVWRYAGSHDAGKGNVRTWLLAIVHHRAIDQLRGRSGRQRGERPLEPVENRLTAPDTWEQVWPELEREQVRRALEDVPETQRRVIDLAYFRGLSHREIAEQTGLPLGTVKSRIKLGLEKLAASLKAAGLRGEYRAVDE